VTDAGAYALSRATDDVAETIRWFEAEGFAVVRELGGPKESFGNVLLEFERGAVRATIVRDRSQWMIDIASAGGKPHGLHVWLAAMRGTRAETGPRRSVGEPLPDQLPVGESWRVEVPAVIDWVSCGDRSAEIDAAARDWGRAMREYFATPRQAPGD
jgi:hypothetical protein